MTQEWTQDRPSNHDEKAPVSPLGRALLWSHFRPIERKAKKCRVSKTWPGINCYPTQRRSSQAVPAPRLRLASTGTPFRTSRTVTVQRPRTCSRTAPALSSARYVPQGILQACPGRRAAFQASATRVGRSLNARAPPEQGLVRARIGRRGRSFLPRFGAIADDAVLALRAPRAVHGRRPLLREGRVGDAPRFHWRSCSFGDNNDRSWYAEVRDRCGRCAPRMWTRCGCPGHSVAPEEYLPQRLYDLNAVGTAENLKALCAELKAAGLLYRRHRDKPPVRGHPGRERSVAHHLQQRHIPRRSSDDGAWKIFDKSWGPWAIVEDDPNFSGEGGRRDLPPRADLGHGNERVRRELIRGHVAEGRRRFSGMAVRLRQGVRRSPCRVRGALRRPRRAERL